MYQLVSPFGGPAYLLAKIIAKTLKSTHAPCLKSMKMINEDRMEYVEKTNSNMLKNTLPLLITLDVASLTIRAAIYKILEKLGMHIILEDYVPQAIADHSYYLLKYWEIDSAVRIAKLELKIFKKILGNTKIIHLTTINQAKTQRIINREGTAGLTKIVGSYDKYARNSLVLTASRYLTNKVIRVETSKEKPLQTHHKIWGWLGL
ncbi:MAG: hypothetical protein J7J67_02855 [Thermoproteales archaeon]|nr:hypothetical protein [Thermoproteales archaeon]